MRLFVKEEHAHLLWILDIKYNKAVYKKTKFLQDLNAYHHLTDSILRTAFTKSVTCSCDQQLMILIKCMSVDIITKNSPLQC